MHALFPNTGTCAGRMITGDGVVYITESDAGNILEVDVATLEVVRTFHVGGKPKNATLTGWWGPVEAP